MTNDIKVNVSGGNLAIGAASQGDRTTTTGTASVDSAELERGFDAARAAIAALALELQRPRLEQDAVLVQLAALKEKALEQPPKVADGKGILKLVKDNFSWAYPAIKDFVMVAWPALLAVIGS